MEAAQLAEHSYVLQPLAAASFIFAACLFLSRINYRSKLAKLPAFAGSGTEKHRTAYLQSAQKMYTDGYKQFKDCVYRITSENGQENIVIPPSLMPELRKIPDTVLNFPKAVDMMMESKYTGYSSEAALMVHSVRADLTPALARLNPIILDISDQAVAENIPPCDEWTPVPIYSKLANMVAKISGRVFVGPELCNNEIYLESSIRYTFDLIEAQHAVQKIRPILKPLLAPRLPQVKVLKEREHKINNVLAPEIKRRREAEKDDPNWQKPDDLLQWLLNRSAGTPDDSIDRLVKLQLAVIFAAIHTTTMMVTNMLYSIAVTPEYVQPLREEIRHVLAENGGTITPKALQQMVKLDSYMKEVTRLYPPGITSANRLVLKGFTLSNGQYIPPGVVVEMPSYPIYQDDANYPESDKFDGFRFYKLRQNGTPTDHARNQFATTNEQNLTFGYGKHACPGRFFAASEIKMMLARLILEYNIKNADGEKERYANIFMGRSISPDPRRVLMFKKVIA